MVVRFQTVLPLPRVPPSVYVFVRTCVRARAAADAAVCLSKSCFMYRCALSTLLLRTRPLPRQHILFERPFCLLLRYLCPVVHLTSMGERRVGWSQLTHRWDLRAFCR
jgi:hypothetical protein